jgi:hypothetical protein
VAELKVALKEWAVICAALAAGRQAVLLRKGGIAEAGGAFRVEHERFWLWPTYAHQQSAGVVEEARPLLERAVANRAEGEVTLTPFAKVERVYYTEDLEKVLSLAGLHLWSEETVRSRFAYRTPGLFVLVVRVYRAATGHRLTETPEQAGCKSWVDLREALAAEGAPVLSAEALAGVVAEVERLLRPMGPA